MTPPAVDVPPSSYTLRHSLAQHPEPPRVLIIEPDPALRTGLAELLRSYGMQVVGTVKTVPEAIATATAERPTVVIAEPRGLGIALVGELRAVDARLPVIIHTTLGHETQPLVRNYGGFALLTKGEASASYLLDVISHAHYLYVYGPPRC